MTLQPPPPPPRSVQGIPGGKYHYPGELTYLDGIVYYPTKVTIMDYDGQTLTEKEMTDLEECVDLARRPTTTWVNVTGLKDLKVIQQLGELFDVHPLALEDTVHTKSPPKIDDYGDALFIIMRKLKAGSQGEVLTEQVSIVLGETYILTFHETDDDPFGGVRQRIRQGRVRIRNSGPDYLVYALLDAIMDAYFPVLERYGDRIEQLEDQAMREPSTATSAKIQDLKREIIHLRQLAWSIRELLAHVARIDDALISKDTLVYLRDVHDHAIRVQEMIESHRELCDGLYEIYVSSLSMRTQDVVRVLTIISTIFLPLNFVASIFGMNFQVMPLAEWAFGFMASIVFMAAVACLMILWFRRKRWL